MEHQEGPTGLEIAGLVGVASVAAAAVASLLLAWAGSHEGITAVVVGAVVGIAVAAVALRRGRSWSVAPWSWADAALLLLVLLVAGSQFVPGFPMAAKNRDPGVYVNHAVAIAEQGSDTLEDPVVATGAEIVVDDDGNPRIVTSEGDVSWRKRPYRSFPSNPEDPGEIVPDFFHLWPTTLATAKDVAGNTGLFNLTPGLALAAVALFWLAVRRAFGVVAATVAAGLLAVNELQVWQARFPTAEALSQVLYAGALLAVVLALSTRWRLAALLGGLLVGVGFVARPEGILVAGMAAAALAVLWALRGLDEPARRTPLRLGHPGVLFALGLVPPLLLGAYQAYGRDSRYAELQEGLPSFAGAAAGFALLVVGAVVLRLALTRVPAVAGRVRAVDRAKAIRVLGYGLTGLFAAFLLFAWLRPELLGENYRIDKTGQRSRGYDELNLRKLAIFITPFALVAAVGAIVVGIRERWSAARWVLVVPGLLIAPILIWEPHIAPNLMWWGRRYVPIVLPTLLVLVGALAGWLWERRGERRVVLRLGTVALVLALAGFMVRQSWDLHGHDELGGSLAVIDALEEVTEGEDAVVVWQGGSTQASNFAVTPFTWLGLPAISGPPNPTAEGLVALQEALGGGPLYLVADGTEPPAGAASVLEEERRITGAVTEYEQTLDRRPEGANPIPVDLTVWRLTPP